MAQDLTMRLQYFDMRSASPLVVLPNLIVDHLRILSCAAAAPKPPVLPVHIRQLCTTEGVWCLRQKTICNRNIRDENGKHHGLQVHLCLFLPWLTTNILLEKARLLVLRPVLFGKCLVSSKSSLLFLIGIHLLNQKPRGLDQPSSCSHKLVCIVLCQVFNSPWECDSDGCAKCMQRISVWEHYMLLPKKRYALKCIIMRLLIMLTAGWEMAYGCTAGQLVLALFVFVTPMTFFESCLAVIFYVAAMLLVGRRQNVGSRLQAAANTLGWYWPGLALGGGVVSPAL